MSKALRVVFRLGLAARAGLAGLINGEPGWNTDNKTMVIGDNTNNPPQIPTSKSVGQVEYSDQFTPLFANIGLKEGGKVAGIPLHMLNKVAGIPIRGATEDDWENRALDGDEEYIEVEIPEPGIPGSIRIKASEALKTKLQSSNLRYFYGTVPPDGPRPGDMWFSETDEIVYLRVGAGNDEADHIWLDFTSFSGGGGGVQFFSNGDSPPLTAAAGDEWYHKAENRLYKYLNNNDHLIWVEQV